MLPGPREGPSPAECSWEWWGGEERRGTPGLLTFPVNIPSACEWNHSKRAALVPLSSFPSRQSQTIHSQCLIHQLQPQHNLMWDRQLLVLWPHPIFLTFLGFEQSHGGISAGLLGGCFSSKCRALPPAIPDGFVLCSPKPWRLWPVCGLFTQGWL